MVAIVTGKGAGIENGSATVLGSRGVLGSASAGRADESVYVNAANGNLVLTDMDEMLVGRGPDAAISRTYNSLGAWDGDNSDPWRVGVNRRVYGLSGSYSGAGTTVKRTDWDGSEATYTWTAGYNGTGAYVATDGGGAYDTLTRTGTTWTWTDGDTQVTESYDDTTTRITARTDTSGNSITYGYTGGLLTQVTTADGGSTVLVYGGTAGNQLQSIVTYAPGPSPSYTRVFYEYDSPAATGRLVKVLVNLSPADNSKTTGTNYETNYTYVTGTGRIATITQSDGTLLTLDYALYGSDYRVSSIVQTVASGVTRRTTYSYDLLNSITTITDNANQVTLVKYDANGNLSRIVTPPVGLEAQPEMQEFVYEGDGDLATARLGPGNTIDYTYDPHGNRVFERDSAGNTITRWFGSRNELLTETHYLTPDPDGAGANPASAPLVTRYVYDSSVRLRYVVTPESRVTEYRYDGFGQQVSKIDYAGAVYGGTALADSTALGLLDSWVSGTVDRSTAQRTDTWYDFRGNVSRTVTYAALDAYGEGTQDAAVIVGATGTTVAQQSTGLYRVTKTTGTAAWNADAQSTIKAEGDFTLLVKPVQNTQPLIAGVSTAPAANATFTTLNYGFYLDFGNIYSMESGTATSLGVAYAAGDSLSITRVGSTITYYKNGTLLRTVTGATGAMYFDSSVYTLGSSMDVSFTPQPIVNGANTSVVQQPDGLYRITKTGGTTATWDADARGTAVATGDFAVQIRPTNIVSDTVVGVSAAPGASSSYTNIAYGLHLNQGGGVYTMESSSSVALGATWAAGDNFWITRVGSTLSYYKGATLEKAIAAGALRTVTGVTGSFQFDSSLYYSTYSVDVGFTPGPLSAPEVSRTDYVYDPSGRLLSRAIAGQGTETYVYDGMGRITSATDMLGATTSTAYNDTSGTTVVTLANGLVRTSTYDNAGDLLTYAESGSGVTTATTSYGYDSLGQLRMVTDPTGQSNYVYYDAIGRKVADIDADGSVTEYRYDLNNNLTSSTAYATRLTSSQLAAVKASAIAIGTATNASVVQQSSGLYRVTKTGAGNAWDADAHSTAAIDGDFILQIKPNTSSRNSVVGVSTSPSTGGIGGFTLGIDFDANGATYLWPNYQSLNTVGYTLWAPGDTFWMQRTGGTVSFYKGATLASAVAAGAIRTTTGVTGSLYLDATLYESGNSVDVGFTPALVTFEAIRPVADTTNDRWNFNVYDLAQRLIETIDGTGSVSQLAYDGDSQLVSTTQRANLVSSTNLTALKAAATAPNKWASPNDGTAWSSPNGTRATDGTVDGANAYKFTVAATGYEQVRQTGIVVAAGDVATFTFWVKGSSTATSVGLGFLGGSTGWGPVGENHAVILSGPGTTQDSGYCSIYGLSSTVWTQVRVTRTMTAADTLQALVQGGAVVGDNFSFAKPIVTVTPSQPVYVPTADSANDRTSRVLYDKDGNVTGTLDAEGYLTETIYDAAGRKVRSIAYANPTGTTTGLRESGTLSDLRSSITLSSANDIRNYWLYDSRGLLRASIDGEGTVTRYDYTAAGYLSQQTRGQKIDPATLAATPPTLATLPAAGTAVLETTAWTYNLYGQKLTQTVTLTGSTTTTTSYAYDNMHRLVSTVTQSGTADARTYSQRYDLRGRLLSELSGVGNAVLAAIVSPSQPQIDQIYIDYGTSYTYDDAGRLTSKNEARGTASGAVAPRTVYYYTADGNLAYEIRSWAYTNNVAPYDTRISGDIVEYHYDSFGERIDTIVYAARINPTIFPTLTGGLASTMDATIHALLSPGADTVDHTDFNVDGTVKQSTDALSNVTTYAYDAFGELITETDPRDGSATIQTSRTYDRRGLLKSEIVDSASGGKMISTSYGYDAFGRALTLTNANGKVTTTTYDRKGRVATVKDALNNTTTYTYDARDNLVAVKDAALNVTRYVYDTADRRIATIDAMGGVVTTAYWPDGQVKFTTEYATRISVAGLDLDVTAAGFTPPAVNVADRTTSYLYDKDGQLRFTIDALNHVVETAYDTRGNTIRTVAYDGAIAGFTPGSITTDWVATQVASLASAPGNRITRAVYDSNDQLVFTIDATGQVTFTMYDAKGMVARTVELSAVYTTAGDPLLTDMHVWRIANLNPTLDRATNAFYDAKGQLSYTIDPLGYVTHYDYDKLGNVKMQTRYADAYTGTQSLDALNTFYATPPATRRVTEFNYDSAGRLEETLVTVQLSPTVIKTSTKLTLDQMGQILTSTEAYGTADASTTAYSYDGVGRVISQTSGSGAAEASTSYYFYDAVGNNTASVDGDNYLSVSSYDALGNVLASTLYAGKVSSVSTASTVTGLQALAGTSASDVTTSATYDSFGEALTSTDAMGSIVSQTYDLLGEMLSQTDQLDPSGSGDDRITSYTYNNFGELAKTHDARGFDSFAWYDLLGRVTRQVDAERYVTDTSYSPGGKVASVTRYDVAIAAGVTISVTSKPDPLPGATFSQTLFAYDKRDDLTSTTDAMGFIESYTIDAFGERAQVRNKLNGSVVNGVTLDTTVYYTYDGRGLVLSETLPVSTKTSGGATIAVVNSFTYDLRGNVKTKVEADGSAEARTTTYTYDVLDRVTRAAGNAVTVVNSDLTDTTNVVPDQTFKYDHRGDVIESKDQGGARTLTWYDHAGNAVAQIVQTDKVSGTDMGVLTRSSFDNEGNVTASWTYGDLMALPSDATGAVPTISGTNYRLTSYSYYRDNRLKETKIAGLTTGEWNGSAFVLTPGMVSGVANTAADIKTLVEYDAAGNVIHQQDARGNNIYMWYDKLGRMVAQVDAENYLTVWTRDSEGNALSETRFATRLTSFTPGSSTPPAGTSDTANDRVTTFVYDRDGRRTEEKRLNVAYTAIAANGAATDVAATDSTAFSKVTYTYNGLGEVLTKTEANLADITVSTTAHDTTSYMYDKIGRLVLETDQAFTGYLGTPVTPVTAYDYDGLNNLRTARVEYDGTGSSADRVTTYTYGMGGRLTSMTDATGKTHDYGYDIAGRVVRDSYTRYKSDGTYVLEAAVTRYDMAGRTVATTFARKDSGGVWRFTVSDVAGAANYDARRMRYDAYGEVTGTTTTGGTTTVNDAVTSYQEVTDYDAGGRVWRTNAGDGVLHFYVYDKAGNQTLTLTSAGADLSARTASDYTALIGSTGAIAASGSITAANAITTVIVYDKRGQMLSTREAGRQLTVSTSQLVVNGMTYNAFGDLASSTDARGYDPTTGAALTFSGGAGYTTTFTYNTMGRLLAKVSPQVAATSAAGVTTNVNPTEYYGYDLAGRLVSTTDANTNRVTRQILAGTGHGGTDALVTREFHPDSGIAEIRYDVFGDARILRNELYNPSSPNAAFTDEAQTFDKMGRLSSVLHRGGALTDSYTYDLLGQQLTNTETWLVSGSPVSVTARTDYDTQGRIVLQQTLGGDITTMVYSWSSTLQAVDVSGAAVAGAGGWVTVTTTPNTAYTTSQSQDVFGHTVSSTDMGGNVTDYRYDAAGRTTRRKVTVGTATDTYNYSYFNTGRLAATGYTNGAPGTGTNYTLWTESYSYDAVGNELTDNLVREIGTNVAYGHYENDHEPGVPPRFVVDGYTFTVSSMTFESLTTTYDALNRMVTYDAATNDFMPASSIHYYYDNNSNIRHTNATYRNLDQYGNVVTTVPPAQDYWYRYDSMNRVVTAKGIQSGGTVISGTTGTDYTYNGAGQRTTASTSFSSYAVFYVGSTMYTVPYTGAKVEIYTYTADGQVATVRIGQTSWTSNSNGTINLIAPTTGALKSSFTYDARHRMTRQLDYLNDGDYDGTAAYDRQLIYNSGGQVDTETVNQRQGSDTFVTTTVNQYTSYQGYMLGSVARSDATTTKNGYAYSTSETLNGYYWRDSLAIGGVTIYNTQVGSLATSYSTSYTYTTSGTLSSAWIADGVSRGVSYVSDTLGQIIRRDEGTIAPHEIWYRFGGKQLGYIGNNGTLETDYQTSINNRTAAPTGSGLFQNGGTTPTAFADFDQSLDPINSYSQGGSGGSYTVKGGETLSAIASQLWGDSSLWYKLADANGITGSGTLAAGQVLAIPGGVMRSTNNASTFQPYDASAAMGDTSPTTPSPPAPQKAKKGCGIIGQILMIAIAVAITAVLTGPLSGAIGSALAGGGTAAAGSVAAIAGGVIGGAIAGAVGSLASQVFGLATGTIDKFSWKGVALAAISGAVGGGLGAVAKAAQAAELSSAVKTAGTLAKGVTSVTKFGTVLGSVAKFVSQGGFVGGAVRGVIGSAVSQGVGLATHLQKNFDYLGVALAGIGGGVSGAVGARIGTPDGPFEAVGADLVSGIASGMANAAARTVITGSDFGDNLLAALPDIIGSTIGNLVGTGIKSASKGGNRSAQLSADDAQSNGGSLSLSRPVDHVYEVMHLLDQYPALQRYIQRNALEKARAMDLNGDNHISAFEYAYARDNAMGKLNATFTKMARASRDIGIKSGFGPRSDTTYIGVTATPAARSKALATAPKGVDHTYAVGDVGSFKTSSAGTLMGYFVNAGDKKDFGQGLILNYMHDTSPEDFANRLWLDATFYQISTIEMGPLNRAAQTNPQLAKVRDILQGRLDQLNQIANDSVDKPLGLVFAGTATLALGGAGTALFADTFASLSAPQLLTYAGGGGLTNVLGNSQYRMAFGGPVNLETASHDFLVGSSFSVASPVLSEAGGVFLDGFFGGAKAVESRGGSVEYPFGCFAAGTPVHGREGLIPIEAVQAGDWVLSQPQFKGERAYRRVTQTFDVGTRPIFELAVECADGRVETIRATHQHPFWVTGRGWSGTEDLRAGDIVERSAGDAATVLTVADTGTSEPVFNFSVDGFHTYYVGEAGIWVHNASHVGDIDPAGAGIELPGFLEFHAGDSGGTQLFRGMKMADDGLPELGNTARTLGARPGRGLDIDVENGGVWPETGGMSVSPDDPLNLPPYRRPPEFGGTGKDPVFTIHSSELPNTLSYRPDPINPTGHGFIEPAMPMSFEEYIAALHGTRSSFKPVIPK